MENFRAPDTTELVFAFEIDATELAPFAPGDGGNPTGELCLQDGRVWIDSDTNASGARPVRRGVFRSWALNPMLTGEALAHFFNNPRVIEMLEIVLKNAQVGRLDEYEGFDPAEQELQDMLDKLEQDGSNLAGYGNVEWFLGGTHATDILEHVVQFGTLQAAAEDYEAEAASEAHAIVDAGDLRDEIARKLLAHYAEGGELPYALLAELGKLYADKLKAAQAEREGAEEVAE
ncbi:hypothetical protein [Roseateles albus]|uniref:hypothetical protein n=1 Tax=Roseateles albus TaxID=2987525 RepID=UPI0023596EE5|nr:hypothetical protein [Roseateles albus]